MHANNLAFEIIQHQPVIIITIIIIVVVIIIIIINCIVSIPVVIAFETIALVVITFCMFYCY